MPRLEQAWNLAKVIHINLCSLTNIIWRIFLLNNPPPPPGEPPSPDCKLLVIRLSPLNLMDNQQGCNSDSTIQSINSIFKRSRVPHNIRKSQWQSPLNLGSASQPRLSQHQQAPILPIPENTTTHHFSRANPSPAHYTHSCRNGRPFYWAIIDPRVNSASPSQMPFLSLHSPIPS